MLLMILLVLIHNGMDAYFFEQNGVRTNKNLGLS